MASTWGVGRSWCCSHWVKWWKWCVFSLKSSGSMYLESGSAVMMVVLMYEILRCMLFLMQCERRVAASVVEGEVSSLSCLVDVGYGCGGIHPDVYPVVLEVLGECLY